MTDLEALTQRLITARLEWDQQPGWRTTAVAYIDACNQTAAVAGTTGLDIHRAISKRLQWTPALPGQPAVRGHTIPDAVQAAVNDLHPVSTMKEAS